MAGRCRMTDILNLGYVAIGGLVIIAVFIGVAIATVRTALELW